MPDYSLTLLESSHWKDYALLDSGNGVKLERFGRYIFVRPESQAMWKPALPEAEWRGAHAVFQPSGEESGGHWVMHKPVDERWRMSHPLPAGCNPSGIKFWAMTTPGRHLGVFPEVAAHWEYMAGQVLKAGRPLRVLNLFGYTGLASLAAAAAGAQVTHVDASKKSVSWARENADLSGLADRPIRWIVEDALKYVQREARRETRYDGIILDPPKFGRGPKGEVWEIYKSLPGLLEACRAVLSPQPVFVIATVYAVRASALHVAQALEDTLSKFKGVVEAGELVTRERSGGRMLSQAVYARWTAS